MMRRVLANRNLRRYIAMRALAMFGNSALWLALGIWAKTLTGSSSAAALVFFAFTVPTLLSPAGGMITDRVRRRPLLIRSNLLAAAVVLLVLFVRDAGQLWLIYVVTFTHGCVHTVTASAQSAFLRTLVPDDDELAEANAALQTAQHLLRLLAPVAGAGLFSAFGGPAVAVMTAGILVLSAAGMATIRVAEPAPHREARSSWWGEFSAGARHLFGRRLLRQLVLTVGTALLVLGFLETLVFAVVDEGLHRSPSFVGVVELALGVGSIAGALTAARLLGRLGPRRCVGLGLVLFAVGSALFVTPNVVLVLVGHTLLGYGVPPLVVSLNTSVQRGTPRQLQGRAAAAVFVCVGGPQAFSIALGATLATVVDYQALAVIMAATMLGCAGYILTRRQDPVVPESEEGDMVAAASRIEV